MRRALGRGLSQLLAEQTDGAPSEIEIASIRANPQQPRTVFDEEALAELTDSIRQFGVLTPILVRPVGEGKYEIIAGERRWRAAQAAGLASLPAVVRSANAQASLEMAIVENVQRSDIGPLEAAEAYDRLTREFGLTQEQVAARVGKARVTIANSLRLLKLPDEAKEALAVGRISEGHGRALLQIAPEKRLAALERILVDGLSVRQVEALAQPGASAKSAPETKPAPTRLQGAFHEYFGSPVRIERGKRKGKIVIEFFGDEDLTRITDKLGIRLDD